MLRFNNQFIIYVYIKVHTYYVYIKVLSNIAILDLLLWLIDFLEHLIQFKYYVFIFYIETTQNNKKTKNLTNSSS